MRVGETVGEIWRTYLARLGPLLTITAILIVPLNVAAAVFDPDYTDIVSNRTASLATIAVLYVIAVPLAYAATAVYLDDERHGRASIKTAFGRIDRLGTLAISTLLFTVCTTVGLLLLILPGLLLAALWSIYVPAIVFEQETATGALGRSNALVRGNTWTVVGIGLTIVLIAVGLALIPTAIGYLWAGLYGAILYGIAVDLAFTPLFGVAGYVIYRRLAQVA